MLRHVGGNSLLAKLAASFLGQTVVRMAAARAGVRDGDPKSVELAMHTLKSSSRQLGATALGELCAEAEERAPSGDLTAMSPLLDRIDAELVRVRDALARETGPEKDAGETH